jgi:hypothetical protein
MPEEPTNAVWEVPHFYTNEARVQTTPWDLTLAFYSIRPVGRATESKPVPLCQVAMSPVLAKVIHRILGEQLASYEKTLGQIPSPPKQPPKGQLGE